MTKHKIFFGNSNNMAKVSNDSVDLIVTSPPYPMIEMWDAIFFQMNPEIKNKFENKDYLAVFQGMHEQMNKVWDECNRVLKEGGIICVNIGDATRTLNKDFQLWSNHTMINKYFIETLKLKALPIILWRKTSNKPNKFMGSGMLPPSAYVTLEHEYILVFRKGTKREFDDTSIRYESAFFWEERNNWFSDVWFDIRGTKQVLTNGNAELRERSAAYPMELVYRLINMFSVYGDTILDPFWGTGTTTLSAMLAKRNSIGYELNKEFKSVFNDYLHDIKKISRSINTNRLEKHFDFITQREETPKHKNSNYGFGVITSQERGIKFYNVEEVAHDKDVWSVKYQPHTFLKKTKQDELFR
ncbi:MAG: site-specific DNA-methyltransferase [Spirochaetia bacterium]|nr:site-specific DNA-methyltransferase [Spirochaetia bacterium]